MDFKSAFNVFSCIVSIITFSLIIVAYLIIIYETNLKSNFKSIDKSYILFSKFESILGFYNFNLSI